MEHRRTGWARWVLALVGTAGLVVASAQPTPSWGEERESGDYVVHPYYLYPQDQKRIPEYEKAVSACVAEIRAWYLEQCGVTFRVAPLKVVRSEQTYAAMKYGGREPPTDGSMPNWWRAVLDAVGGWNDHRVQWVFAQGGGGVALGNLQDDFKGAGIFGDWVLEPISGVENPEGIPASKATWQVEGGMPKGTTVHELAHAFGLHHPDDYPGKSLMRWHGDYPDVGFLPHEKMILRQSPFFTGEAPDPEAPYPSFATPDHIRWGETLGIPGRRFAAGAVVEFVHLVDGQEAVVVAQPTSLVQGRIEVVVPDGVGPGYFRIRQGERSSHGVPLNVYPPAKPAPPAAGK